MEERKGEGRRMMIRLMLFRSLIGVSLVTVKYLLRRISYRDRVSLLRVTGGILAST